jgi:hypothetical protein
MVSTMDPYCRVFTDILYLTKIKIKSSEKDMYTYSYMHMSERERETGISTGSLVEHGERCL